MEALFNAQIGMAFGIIGILLVVLLLVMAWTRRMGSDTAAPRPGGPQSGTGGAVGTAGPRPDQPKPEAHRTAERRKKQILIQGKDAEIAASVLRRMLSDHDRS